MISEPGDKGVWAVKPIRSVLSFLLTSLLLFTLFQHSASADAEPVGVVVAVRGMVTAARAGQLPRRLALKSPIFVADAVKTDKRGRIQMMFNDNTLISLGPSSEMKMADYDWNPKSRNGTMTTEVREGFFRVMGGGHYQDLAPEF